MKSYLTTFCPPLSGYHEAVDVIVRRAEPRDVTQLAALRHALWSDADVDEHARELTPLLAGKTPGVLPATVLVALDAECRIVGFIEVGLRSHADGCDPSKPVGFVEGWYVASDWRGRKIGTRLLTEAEAWARHHGCREMASDTWLNNVDSQRVHEAVGFEVVDRCACNELPFNPGRTLERPLSTARGPSAAPPSRPGFQL